MHTHNSESQAKAVGRLMPDGHPGKSQKCKKVLSPENHPHPPPEIGCLFSLVRDLLIPEGFVIRNPDCPVCGEGADFHVAPILMIDLGASDDCGIQMDHGSFPGCVGVLITVQQGTGARPGCTGGAVR